MGYTINYELNTIPASECKAARLAFVQACDRYDPFSDACKWYEHQSDAESVSRTMPGGVICIHGAGEDQGDEWMLYAFKGKSVKHKREAWRPPDPPPDWKPTPAEEKAIADAAANREREMAELKRLTAKYG